MARVAVIQVCVDTFCLVHHICNVDEHCPNFAKFRNDASVRLVSVAIESDRRVLRWSGLHVAEHFDLHKEVKASPDQPSLLTLIGDMIHRSCHGQEKPRFRFIKHGVKTIDEDHIKYVTLEAYICFPIYKRWIERQRREPNTCKIH